MFRSLCCEIPCEVEIQIEITFSRLAEELRNEVTVAVASFRRTQTRPKLITNLEKVEIKLVR